MPVEWSQLLLPIVLATVLVFVASSLLHMVFKYHAADCRQLSNEPAVLGALRQGQPAPGMYMFPHCADHKQMNSPEMQRKYVEGPVGILFVRPSGAIQMGPFLMQWVVYSLAISAVIAYLARAELHAGVGHRAVFRLVGTAAWFAYAWQAPANSIWKGVPWSVTCKEMFDGLIYACVTAGVFAWLWPATG